MNQEEFYKKLIEKMEELIKEVKKVNDDLFKFRK